MKIQQVLFNLEVKVARSFVRNYIFISALTFIIIIGGIGYLILFPKYKLYSLQKNVELVDLQKQFENQKSQLNKLEISQSEFSKVQNNIELKKLTDLLPNKKEVEKIFVQFEAIAKEERFQIVNLTISEDLSRNLDIQQLTGGRVANNDIKNINIRKIQIQVSIAGGGYDSLKSLLKSFEQSLRLLDVNSLSFVPNFQGKTLYNLTLSTYYIP